MKINQKKEFWLIACMALCLILFLWFLLIPQTRHYLSIKKEIGHKTNEMNTVIKAIDDYRSINSRYALLEKNLAELNKNFSTNMQDGLFIVQFNQKLNKEQVELKTFKAVKLDEKKYTQLFPFDSGFITVLPIQLELYGEYQNLVNVLDFLENQADFTEIRDLKLEAGDEQSRPAGDAAAADNSQPGQQYMSLASGRIKANCVLLIFTSPLPREVLPLEEKNTWKFGKTNPFKSSAYLPPITP
jgi:type IV pilus assembly protein PilO